MKFKKHYAWVICFCGLLMNICAIGMVAGALSVYFPYLMESLSLTNTQISMISTIRCLSGTLTAMVVGTYYRKLSLRSGIPLNCLLFVLSCVIFAHASTALHCYIAAVILGIYYALGGMVPTAILVNNWFHDRRSTALAICACGSGLCNVVMPPVITMAVESLGIRASFYLEAGFIALCAVLFFLLLRDKPADKGLEPYQEDGYEQKNRRVQTVVSHATPLELRLIMFSIFIVGLMGTPSTAHYTVHYRNIGYSSLETAAAMSVYGLLLFVGKLLLGACTDRFGAYRSNYFFIGIWFVSCLLTANVNGTSLLMLYGAAALNGLGVPIGTIGITTWAGELAKPEDYNRSVQRSQVIFSLGALLGNPFPGITADHLGSYAPIYLLYAVMLVVSLAITQIIYRRHLASPASKV